MATFTISSADEIIVAPEHGAEDDAGLPLEGFRDSR